MTTSFKFGIVAATSLLLGLNPKLLMAEPAANFQPIDGFAIDNPFVHIWYLVHFDLPLSDDITPGVVSMKGDAWFTPVADGTDTQGCLNAVTADTISPAGAMT